MYKYTQTARPLRWKLQSEEFFENNPWRRGDQERSTTKAHFIHETIYHCLAPAPGTTGLGSYNVSLFALIAIIQEINGCYQYLTAINI